MRCASCDSEVLNNVCKKPGCNTPLCPDDYGVECRQEHDAVRHAPDVVPSTTARGMVLNERKKAEEASNRAARMWAENVHLKARLRGFVKHLEIMAPQALADARRSGVIVDKEFEDDRNGKDGL
jgi:hypothetical protein